MCRTLTMSCWLLMAAAGCELASPSECRQDYECAVGQVCASAAASEGSCIAAEPGAERTFGEAELAFQTGEEAYLVNIFALPRGPAADPSFVRYALNVAGTTDAQDNALRLRRVNVASGQKRWRQRFEFDRWRAEQTLKWSSELRRGLRRWRAAGRRQVDCDCGAESMCWQGTCTESPTVAFVDGSEIDTRLLAVVGQQSASPINVLLDASISDAATEQAAEDAARAFAETFANELELLGLGTHAGPADRNKDGRLTVVFTNETAPDVPLDNVGFFNPADFLPAEQTDATGNATDLLWARLPGTTNPIEITKDVATGTLAHEYTHLASFAVRVWDRPDDPVPESLWLDEGLAHLLEDLTGWGPSNVPVVAEALPNWSLAGFGRASGGATNVDTPAQRGQSYLLLRHLIDMQARARGARDAASETTQAVAVEIVSSLISEPQVGYEHTLFVDAGPDAVAEWLLGVFTTGNDLDVTRESARRSTYLSPAPHPVTGHQVGITTHGELPDARGETIYLGGLDFLDVLLGADTFADSELQASGSAFYVVTATAPGTHVLTATGDAQTAFHLSVEQIR